MNPTARVTRWGSLLALTLVVALLCVVPTTAADKKKAKKNQTEPVQKTETKVVASRATSTPAAATALAQRIDTEINKRLQAEKIQPSGRSSDSEFVRRVYLDILGVIPTAEQAKAFLDSTESQKRSKLIDDLLTREQYGRHMADLWQAMMLPRTSDNRRLNSAPLTAWLADNFNKNTPWDRFVYNLVTATGNQEENGAVTYFLANGTVDKVTDNVTRLFLGVQLQCAQCHNHPFTGWKQTEYWGMAAFFMKVQPDNVNKAAKNGGKAGVIEKNGKVNPRRLPESAKMVPAKFLQGEEPKLKTTDPYRPVLAEWMTARSNPYFARATVNRLWAQFFGRGLVNPVDDMHDNNPASHPDLLRGLAQDFANDHFDVKNLIRGICNSEAYQRSCKPTASNASAPASVYARMAVKVMSPEQLYDSLTAITGSVKPERPVKNAQKRPQTGRDAFVNFFQVEEGADPTEYQAGIPQVLRLMNSNQFNNTAVAASLVRAGKKPEEVIEHLFLTTLARRPTAAERSKLTALVEKNTARDAYADILWVLLNSSEFTLNH